MADNPAHQQVIDSLTSQWAGYVQAAKDAALTALPVADGVQRDTTPPDSQDTGQETSQKGG